MKVYFLSFFYISLSLFPYITSLGAFKWGRGGIGRFPLPTFSFSLKKNLFFLGWDVFLGVVFFWGLVVSPLPNTINLSRTYEKLHCKGEPYGFFSQQDPLVQTDMHRYSDFHIRISLLLFLTFSLTIKM